jgi:hypothetical protein
MKKLFVFVFAVTLLGSCSSEKVLSEKLKYDWNINYLENDDNNISFSPIEELKHENLIASSKKIFLNNKKQFVSISRKVEELKEINSDCDNIIFKNGDELSAKVIEITTEVVKYKRCDNLEGPLISVSKKEILMIRYKNGTKEIFNNNENNLNTSLRSISNTNPDSPKLKVEGLSLTSMITAILAAILPVSNLSVVLISCSIFFSFFGLNKIDRNPEKFKGKGFAIAGLAISAVVGIILYIFL